MANAVRDDKEVNSLASVKEMSSPVSVKEVNSPAVDALVAVVSLALALEPKPGEAGLT